MKKILLLLLCLSAAKLTTAQVVINEWMASNSSTISDPDFDNSGDWIELYNTSSEAVDLSGFFLTDNRNYPERWSFPDASIIAPNDFLIIWADGEDTGLHCNFKLTKEGERIQLYDTTGVVMDEIVYKHQKTDVSMGRKIDGDQELVFFEEPSPGASNTNSPYFEGISFFKTRFSKKGGMYDEGFELNLENAEGKIYYTLDGSFPTTDSYLYDNPITISNTSIVRAAVFVDNFIPGPTVTHTYFINENLEERGLPVISISSNPEYFWDDDIGLYVQDFKPDWEYPINIEMFENDGSDRAAFNELAGTRVNGQNSWQLPQKMLGIYFDNEYDNNNLDYQLFFDRDRKQFDNFTLRASGSDWSFTLFRDALCQELTKENMDIESMAYKPAIAFINGNYMGIHNFRSRVDESFIEDNFNLSSDAYDLIENNGNVEQGNSIAFNQLYNYVDSDLSIQSNYDGLSAILDIENTMDYFISQLWASNGSWGHNVQLWKPKDGGKWRWILQDFDRGFTGSSNDGLSYFTTSNNPSSYNYARDVLEGLLQNEAFANAFISRAISQLYTSFHPKRVRSMIDQFAKRIEKEMPYHAARWAGTTSVYGNGISSVAYWEDEVEDLRTFADERQAFVQDELRDRFSLDNSHNLSISNFPVEGGTVKINDLKIPEANWSGPYFGSLDYKLEAFAAVGYQFEGWSKASFETLIEKEAEWIYLDNGTDQGTDWQLLDFNDSGWNLGQAQLGYGDGDENTVIFYGGVDDEKHITSYFRKTFTIDNLEEYTGELILNLLRDDGAVVYLNGQEIVRSNMPSGPIDYLTGASSFISGNSEDLFLQFGINAQNLKQGENIIAIEIHQFNANSSDVSFDFELKAAKISNGSFFSVDKTITGQLNSNEQIVANYIRISDCILDTLISENTILTIDCSPYLAPATVRVASGVELNIDPGVKVLFPEEANLIINGVLNINGTEEQNVLFEALDDDSFWGGLSFQESSAPSNLHWFEIKDATGASHPIYHNAAISAFKADVKMDHLTITEVHGNPILGYYASMELRNSRLHSKITGDLINVKYGQAHIDQCVFEGNQQVDTDAIDYDDVENGTIRNSKIYNFFGFNSDGIDVGEESKNLTIENNFIHNCTDKGISIGQLSTVAIRNNTIVNCNQGIAVKDYSFADIDKNTFYNTSTAVACFEKNVGEGGGGAQIKNSILSNSPDQSTLTGVRSSLYMENCLSDTDSLSGISNIFGNPLFSNPSQNDFTLQPNSPAIGAGTAAEDLGTDSHLYTAPAVVHISGINYNPLLDEFAEFIHLYNPSAETIHLEGYQFTDGVLYEFPDLSIAPQEKIWLIANDLYYTEVQGQVESWTEGRLSNGGEKIRLIDSHGIVIDQVAYRDTTPWPIDADGLGGHLVLSSHDLDNHFASSWISSNLVSDNNLEKPKFKVYPNPSMDFIQFELPENEKRNFTLRLLDVKGNVLDEWSEPTRSLQISSYPSGTYIIQWIQEGQMIHAQKIVKI